MVEERIVAAMAGRKSVAVLSLVRPLPSQTLDLGRDSGSVVEWEIAAAKSK